MPATCNEYANSKQGRSKCSGKFGDVRCAENQDTQLIQMKPTSSSRKVLKNQAHNANSNFDSSLPVASDAQTGLKFEISCKLDPELMPVASIKYETYANCAYETYEHRLIPEFNAQLAESRPNVCNELSIRNSTDELDPEFYFVVKTEETELAIIEICHEELKSIVPSRKNKFVNSETDVSPQVSGADKSTQESLPIQPDVSPIKKYKRKYSEAHPMNRYNNKRVMNYLMRHGYSSENLNHALRTFRVQLSAAEHNLNEMAEMYQSEVNKEHCTSNVFNNTLAWLRQFDHLKLLGQEYYEHAQLLYNIAHTEEHPDPAKLGGIDLKWAYEYLANSLMGMPQKKLDGPTAEFMKRELKQLVKSHGIDIEAATIIVGHNE